MDNKLKKIIFGSVYFPEQWPEEIWYEDAGIIKKAGLNAVFINVFNWVFIEKAEGIFDFEQLDKVISLLEENNVLMIFSTPTAAPPAWASKKYDKILPVDKNGIKYFYGSRQTFCPNSPDYFNLVKKITEKLAERYADRNNIIMWNINNEYGAYVGECYCENCQKAFSGWLHRKYASIDNLNRIWNTAFWSQTYCAFDEIPVPGKTGCAHNPSLMLDYKRFMNDSFLSVFRLERDIIKKYSNAPVMTSFPSSMKPLDFFRWTDELDSIALNLCSESDRLPDFIPDIMKYDIIRGIKNENPFLLNGIIPGKKVIPNMHCGYSETLRFSCYEAIAHGADGVLFSSFRQPLSGNGKFSRSIVGHSGKPDITSFSEIEELGNEIKRLSAVSGSRVNSRAAIIIDFEVPWALDSDRPLGGHPDYLKLIAAFYMVIFNLGIQIDFIQQDSAFESYGIVIAPMMYIMKNEFVEKSTTFINSGGTFIFTFLSGLISENGSVCRNNFDRLLGIETFNNTILRSQNEISISFKGESKQYKCDAWIESISVTDAKVLAVYNGNGLDKMPAVTINKMNEGRCVYISTWPSSEFITKIFELELDLINMRPVLDTPKDVHTVRRLMSSGKQYIFILNYSEKIQKISLGYEKYRDLITGEIISRELKLDAFDVKVLCDV